MWFCLCVCVCCVCVCAVCLDWFCLHRRKPRQSCAHSEIFGVPCRPPLASNSLVCVFTQLVNTGTTHKPEVQRKSCPGPRPVRKPNPANQTPKPRSKETRGHSPLDVFCFRAFFTSLKNTGHTYVFDLFSKINEQLYRSSAGIDFLSHHECLPPTDIIYHYYCCTSYEYGYLLYPPLTTTTTDQLTRSSSAMYIRMIYS